MHDRMYLIVEAMNDGANRLGREDQPLREQMQYKWGGVMGKILVSILIVVILVVSGCNSRVGQEERREALKNLSVGMNRLDVEKVLSLSKSHQLCNSDGVISIELYLLGSNDMYSASVIYIVYEKIDGQETVKQIAAPSPEFLEGPDFNECHPVGDSLLVSLGTIFPEPNSSLSIDSFQQATNSPEVSFVALEDSSICLEIWGNGLVEPGEFDSTNQEIMERFSLSINGDEYFEKPVIYTSDADGRTVLDNSGTGDIEYFIPSGFPSILCYYIPPVAGDYLITMNYLSKSNQLFQYQWSFHLTED